MSDTDFKTPKAVKADIKTETAKIEAVAAPIEAKVDAKFDAAETKVESKIEAVTAKATAAIEDVQARVRDGASKATEFAREAYSFNKGTVETVVKAGQIYGEGLQGLATHAAGATREQFDETVATLRHLVAARSIGKVIELQTELARSTAKRALTESTKLVEGYLKVAGDAIAPLTARALEAADQVKKAA